jgi:hypothetical protein
MVLSALVVAHHFLKQRGVLHGGNMMVQMQQGRRRPCSSKASWRPRAAA